MTTDAKILSALRANPDGVSGAQLAEQLGISRAAVWARIEELRRVGYEIEAGPHFGYRFWVAEFCTRTSADCNGGRASSRRERHKRLADTHTKEVIGRDIRVFEQTTSTNDVDGKTRARRREGRRRRVCRIADEGPGTAGPQMDFAARTRACGFPFCCGRSCARRKRRN